MRNLFLALLLANLAFAAWQAWVAPPAAGRVSSSDEPAIRLVAEDDGRVSSAKTDTTPADIRAPDAGASPAAAGTPEAAEAAAGETDTADSASGASAAAAVDSLNSAGVGAVPAVASLTVAAAASSGDRRCVSVGPFGELSDAAAASARLRTAGYEPSQRVGEGDIWVGYWVYLENIPTRDEANEALATLHDNGVAEAYLIPGEQDGDIISLGVFSQITRAGRLRDEVRDLGFDPAVVDRTRSGTVYWIDVRLGAAQELDFDALQSPGRIMRLEQRACESAGI